MVNMFSKIGEEERKERITKSIGNLCILDIEKVIKLNYNICGTLCVSVCETLHL